VLSALAYAHVKRDLDGNPLRLIHRDVSPSNILVSHAGEVKLTDFGIAKAATHNSLFYKVKGKIGYMSPEQARSEQLDHRSDLYSLAVCMYEVLTGERLFVHAGLTTSADEIYSQPVPLVSRKVPGLTTDLDAIMRKALALSPDDRFQTAGEFQEALTRCAHRNGLLVSVPEVARELVDRCGPPDQWRGDEEDDDLGYVHRAATEVYDGNAEGEMEGEDDDDAFAASVTSGSFSVSRHTSSRISRPRTELAKGGVVELTSIINMIDLEQQHREAMGDRSFADLRIETERRRPDPAPSALDVQSGWTIAGPPPIPRSALPGVPVMPSSQLRAMPLPAAPRPPLPAPFPAAASSMPHPGPPRLADPSDGMPTLPRQLPPVAAGPPPAARPARPVPHFQAPGRGRVRTRKRSLLQPWMVIVAIILAAAVAGVIIALSGPNVAVQRGK
jgi:serine/threonine protein kinase